MHSSSACVDKWMIHLVRFSLSSLRTACGVNYSQEDVREKSIEHSLYTSTMQMEGQQRHDTELIL